MRFRSALGICLCLSFLIVGVAHGAPVRRERVVEISYVGGALGADPGSGGGGFCPVDAFDPEDVCVAVEPRPGEKYVRVEMKDVSGQQVSGSLMQGGGADPESYRSFGRFCGAHEKSVRMVSSVQQLQVWYYNGFCESGEPSVVTTGTVVVTFSNLP